jgi:hypothetical protein
MQNLEPTSGLEPLTCRYELSSGLTSAAAKSVAAKDPNNFRPARKKVLSMLIQLL